jgi:hypothetical protein
MIIIIEEQSVELELAEDIEVPPQMSYEPTWDRARDTMPGNKRLKAWTLAQPMQMWYMDSHTLNSSLHRRNGTVSSSWSLLCTLAKSHAQCAHCPPPT